MIRMKIKVNYCIKLIISVFLGTAFYICHMYYPQNISLTVYDIMLQTKRLDDVHSSNSEKMRNSTKDGVCFPFQTFSNCGKLNVDMPMGGQLGNSMFTYAATLAFSSYYDAVPCLAPEDPIPEVFNITLPSVSPVKLYPRVFKEKAAHKYDSKAFFVELHGDSTFYGYFQSWKYFADPFLESLVRKEFTFKDRYDNIATLFLSVVTGTVYKGGNITQIHISSDKAVAGKLPSTMDILQNRQKLHIVGIHIRRGDMITYSSRGFKVAPDTYIHEAMNYFEKKYSKSKLIFIICTDSKTWVLKKIFPQRSPVFLSVGHSGPVDLAILSKCDDIIMTVETFGWWAGWLANGEVIYYKNYPSPGSAIARSFSHADYYPPHWIPME